MFLGDADQKATDIRPTAIKGALRFWWRALNGHMSTQDLAKEEARLFGSTNGGGVFSLAVSQLEKFQAMTDWPPADPNASSSYMGYGLTGDKQNPHREYIPSGLKFTITISLQTKKAEDKSAIQASLEAFGLFGSLGSRARRGFGSVQLIELNQHKFDAPTKSSIKTWLASQLTQGLKIKSQLEYTAFGSDSLFSIPEGIKEKDYKTAHTKIGGIYKQARALHSTRDRAVFGLPLKNVNENLRRASPVFFKVIKHANGSYGALILFIPSQFHPEFSSASYEKIKPLLDAIKAEKCA
ncbi:MAG: type III-B CRISPR module RAMP protein Cmr1 [Proteobacteria bacterium]|nr:type III-B CRISPR module RAMP protein Cmr1 [Pseudomonadota bacterium]